MFEPVSLRGVQYDDIKVFRTAEGVHVSMVGAVHGRAKVELSFNFTPDNAKRFADALNEQAGASHG